jgi:hypothetical protein
VGNQFENCAGDRTAGMDGRFPKKRLNVQNTSGVFLLGKSLQKCRSEKPRELVILIQTGMIRLGCSLA